MNNKSLGDLEKTVEEQIKQAESTKVKVDGAWADMKNQLNDANRVVIKVRTEK